MGEQPVRARSVCGLPCEVYSRVVGYFRPVQQWNKGKQAEFKDRKPFETKFKGRVSDGHGGPQVGSGSSPVPNEAGEVSASAPEGDGAQQVETGSSVDQGGQG